MRVAVQWPCVITVEAGTLVAVRSELVLVKLISAQPVLCLQHPTNCGWVVHDSSSTHHQCNIMMFHYLTCFIQSFKLITWRVLSNYLSTLHSNYFGAEPCGPSLSWSLPILSDVLCCPQAADLKDPLKDPFLHGRGPVVEKTETPFFLSSTFASRSCDSSVPHCCIALRTLPSSCLSPCNSYSSFNTLSSLASRPDRDAANLFCLHIAAFSMIRSESRCACSLRVWYWVLVCRSCLRCCCTVAEPSFRGPSDPAELALSTLPWEPRRGATLPRLAWQPRRCGCKTTLCPRPMLLAGSTPAFALDLGKHRSASAASVQSVESIRLPAASSRAWFSCENRLPRLPIASLKLSITCCPGRGAPLRACLFLLD